MDGYSSTSAAIIFWLSVKFQIAPDTDIAVAAKGVAMRIIARCPDCSNNWLMDAAAADKRIRCRACGRLFKVPKLEEVPKAVKIIKQAKGTIYVDEAGRTYG